MQKTVYIVKKRTYMCEDTDEKDLDKVMETVSSMFISILIPQSARKTLKLERKGEIERLSV